MAATTASSARRTSPAPGWTCSCSNATAGAAVRSSAPRPTGSRSSTERSTTRPSSARRSPTSSSSRATASTTCTAPRRRCTCTGTASRSPSRESAEDTARSIAEVDAADAEAWMELVALSGRLLALTGELTRDPPVPMEPARTARERGAGTGRPPHPGAGPELGRRGRRTLVPEPAPAGAGRLPVAVLGTSSVVSRHGSRVLPHARRGTGAASVGRAAARARSSMRCSRRWSASAGGCAATSRWAG